MKKALINGTNICQVADAEFPVHPSLLWADVPDDTTARDSYVNGVVVKYVAPVPIQPSKDEVDALAAKQYAKLQALTTMTPAQVQSWVSANVTNLAQAQDAITTLAVAVSVLARRM